MGLRLKSPASILFTQPFIQAEIKENIKAPRNWPLCGDFAGTGEFPAQMAGNAEMFSFDDVIRNCFVISSRYYVSPVCAKSFRSVMAHFQLDTRQNLIQSKQCQENTSSVVPWKMSAILSRSLLKFRSTNLTIGVWLWINKLMILQKY